MASTSKTTLESDLDRCPDLSINQQSAAVPVVENEHVTQLIIFKP